MEKPVARVKEQGIEEMIKELKKSMRIEIEFKPHIEIKPHIEVNPTIIGYAPIDNLNISIIPTVNRYFYILQSDIHLTSDAIIPADQFNNDDGNQVVEFVDFGQNGYFNLYLNGVMQEGKIYTVSTNSLTITATGQTITAGTPIIIEAVGFSGNLLSKNMV